MEHKCSLGKVTRQEDSNPNILFFVSPGSLFPIYYLLAALDQLPFSKTLCMPALPLRFFRHMDCLALSTVRVVATKTVIRFIIC